MIIQLSENPEIFQKILPTFLKDVQIPSNPKKNKENCIPVFAYFDAAQRIPVSGHLELDISAKEITPTDLKGIEAHTVAIITDQHTTVGRILDLVRDPKQFFRIINCYSDILSYNDDSDYSNTGTIEDLILGKTIHCISTPNGLILDYYGFGGNENVFEKYCNTTLTAGEDGHITMKVLSTLTEEQCKEIILEQMPACVDEYINVQKNTLEYLKINPDDVRVSCDLIEEMEDISFQEVKKYQKELIAKFKEENTMEYLDDMYLGCFENWLDDNIYISQHIDDDDEEGNFESEDN